MKHKLHIVCFDVPYPADYGGVIDVLYKIRSLWEVGVCIRLHVFKHGREAHPELKKYCESVYYYDRHMEWYRGLSLLPFTVLSRKNELLLERLREWEAPVLFEGLHTSWPLNKENWSDRKILVRAHNVEHEYYRGLLRSEPNFIKKIYYLTEAWKLKPYEKRLKFSDWILAISPRERDYFVGKFGEKALYIPPFHANSHVRELSGKGFFALYHGNLKVVDNLKAAAFLIEVFSAIDYPLVIAGRDPDRALLRKAALYPKINFIELQDEAQLQDLMQRAHINILISFQSTGMKLKLINALFQGRFCIANKGVIEGTGLSDLCTLADRPKEIQRSVIQLMDKDYSEKELSKRKRLLKEFDNRQNALRIATLLDQ